MTWLLWLLAIPALYQAWRLCTRPRPVIVSPETLNRLSLVEADAPPHATGQRTKRESQAGSGSSRYTREA